MPGLTPRHVFVIDEAARVGTQQFRRQQPRSACALIAVLLYCHQTKARGCVEERENEHRDSDR
jgi:hypothetical protein